MVLERDAIEAALAKHDRNIEKAAQELGASRRTLQNRMRAYGMVRGKSGRRKQDLPYPPTTRATRWVRRNKSTLGVLGTVAAVGAAVLGYKHLRKG
jgi:hypothetical protein